MCSMSSGLGMLLLFSGKGGNLHHSNRSSSSSSSSSSDTEVCRSSLCQGDLHV
jgi:hypothetical protein